MRGAQLRFIFLRQTPPGRALRRLWHNWIRLRTEHREAVSPNSTRSKQRLVKEYGRRFGLRTLVETGTFRGQMVWACRRDFRRIISVELAPVLARRAQERFRAMPHITILEGDSTDVLPGILADLYTPALFWLDGHYSGGETALGRNETPLREELRSILSHAVPGHVVLIDDARAYTGGTDYTKVRPEDYPALEEIRGLAARHWPSSQMEISSDVIRIYRKQE